MPMPIDAEPHAITVELGRTALVIIDMQRDFLEAGGFGESLGNDVSLLHAAVAPCQAVLAAARAAGMLIIHTREGHRPDMADCPPAKWARGRILIRGEPGHDIIPELAPAPGEVVLDKPGKGAFCATDMDLILRSKGIEALLVCGVTTEVCVNTTVREANDRGYRCVVVADACASYFPAFHAAALAMVKAQGGIFGWVAPSKTRSQAAWKAGPSKAGAIGR